MEVALNQFLNQLENYKQYDNGVILSCCHCKARLFLSEEFSVCVRGNSHLPAGVFSPLFLTFQIAF